MPDFPEGFLVDEDPFTEEDGVGDNVNGPLPEIDPADFAETPEAPTGAAALVVAELDAATGFGGDV